MGDDEERKKVLVAGVGFEPITSGLLTTNVSLTIANSGHRLLETVFMLTGTGWQR